MHEAFTFESAGRRILVRKAWIEWFDLSNTERPRSERSVPGVHKEELAQSRRVSPDLLKLVMVGIHCEHKPQCLRPER